MEFSPGVQHVAVFAFPFGSHAAPLLSLVRRIASEAPHVTFSFFSTSKSNASIFSGINKEKIQNLKSYNVDDGLPENYVPTGNPIEPIFLFIKAMSGNYRRALDEAVADTGKKITCFLTDAFLWFGAEMAEEMKAKWVALWTAGPQSVVAHVATDLLRQRLRSNDASRFRVFWSRLFNSGEDRNIDFLPGFSGVKFSDLPEGVVSDTEQPFADMLHKLGLALPRATAVAMNAFVEVHPLMMDELKSNFQMLLNVGPFTLTTPQSNIPDDEGCLEWLNKHKKASVVYISFGSVIMPPPHELTAIAEALEECNFPFIWSFRGNPEKQLPEGFLERTSTKGKVVSWAPQMEILKHASVGVCVTHCGWNSIMDCMVGGVPMICRPFFGDQKLNTRFLESVWGIGVGIENGVFTKSSTVKALESILLSEKRKIMRQRVVELNELAMQAVEPSGSSTRDLKTLIHIVTA